MQLQPRASRMALPISPFTGVQMADETSKNLPDTRKEVLDLLKDLQAHYGTYHNHKENVGWAGVALFAVLMAGIATAVRQRSPQIDFSSIARGGVSLLVIGVWLVCFAYVYKQFDLRKRAADLVAACICLRSQVISNPSKAIELSEWGPPKQAAASGSQSAYVLPQAIQSLLANSHLLVKNPASGWRCVHIQ